MNKTLSTPYAPADLPPKAVALASQYADTLRRLPPVLAASLLTQVRGYDWQFPAEQRELEEQLHLLAGPPDEKMQRVLTAFRALPMPQGPEGRAWTAPEMFLQAFTAHLWQVHATEQFRDCGEAYGNILSVIREKIARQDDRLVIVLIGRGSRNDNTPIFEKLKQKGTYFPNLRNNNVFEEAIRLIEKRTSTANERHDHWFLDGAASSLSAEAQFTYLSYDELNPVRKSLATYVRGLLRKNDMGPEKIRSSMMSLKPADLNGFPAGQDDVMRNFAVRVLCDGSGTQNLSTSFVQWSAREVLRRAQPVTLLARFAPRRKIADFLDDAAGDGPLDAEGALIDADMGAYYTWINLQRLSGKGRKCFVAIAENGQGAVAVGPGMSAGTTATNAATLTQVVSWMLS